MSGYDRKEIIERDDYTCQNCRERFADSRPLEVAHIVARSDGGSDSEDNLVTLCVGCHSEFDGWTVGDFNSNRVERVASYVYHRERLRGAAFIARCGRLLGVDYDTATDLLDNIQF